MLFMLRMKRNKKKDFKGFFIQIKTRLKLNPDKCSFELDTIEILGHLATAEGIKPDPKKVDSVLKASRPENVGILHSFLGTCGFLMKLIPNYTGFSEPLCMLMRKGIDWEWDSKAESAFKDLKQALTNEPCLVYYKLGAPVVVVTDASSVGLVAILLQTQQDGSRKPVAYTSCNLTVTERRYFPTE